MTTKSSFSTYFHAVPALSNCCKKTCKENAINLLCLLSYFTIIIPLGMAIGYAASLCGRTQPLDPNDPSLTPKRASSSFQRTKGLQSTSTDIPGTCSPQCGIPPSFDNPSPQESAFASTGAPGSLSPELKMSAAGIIATPESSTVHDYPGDLSSKERTSRQLYIQKLDEYQLLVSQNGANAALIRRADIFESGASVIVNAANTHLGGGGGIDGSIHKQGGATYKEAHKALQTFYKSRYIEGYASMIESGSLQYRDPPISNVIVVAGPIGPSSSPQKESQLYSCYYNSLVLANSQGHQSIAFPSISTGLFRYPEDRAAAISIRAISDFLIAYPDTCITQISIHFRVEEDKLGPYLNLKYSK